MFRLKGSLSSPLHRAPTTSLSGATAASFPGILSLTSLKLREVYFLRLPSLMAGRPPDRTTLRRHSWNAGKRIVRKCIPSGKSLSAQKLSSWQTAQHRLLELSGGASCGLFSAKYIVAEHPRHHTIAAQEVNLKAMCLLFRARFGVDTTDIFFRLRIGTFSSWHND
jgi:hypothetical protein